MTDKPAADAKTLDPVEVFIGERVRQCRERKKISQTTLAQAIGVTFQQVQKYEKGANRIAASTLLAMARFFETPVSYFLVDESESFRPAGFAEPGGASYTPETWSESLQLAQAFGRIASAPVRKSLIELTEAMAAPSPKRTRDAKSRRTDRA